VRHREDGPAVIDDQIMQQWWVQGLLHREDGPAVEYDDGDQEWYLGGAPTEENIVMDSGKRAEFLKSLAGRN
jgi:hypothetical protein